MKTSEQTAKLDAALAKAQGEFDAVTKDANNPHYSRSYADLASVYRAVRAALSANGISHIQSIPREDGGYVVETRLAHAGEWIMTTCPVAVDDQRGRNASQSLGSGTTYARRYALMAALGLAPEDDDAEAAGRREQPRQQRPGPRKPPPMSPQAFIDAADLMGIPSSALNAYRVAHGKEPLSDETDGFHLRQVLVNLQGGEAQAVQDWMADQ